MLAVWWFDVPVMLRLVPDQPPMVVLTAFATLPLGTAEFRIPPGNSTATSSAKAG
ncbi:UNVERIFIED_ORG: hypothetical protein J2W75_003285 [Methylorubrum zatmanii]|nr:hypothetical protein [Methylorubrum extorquens]